MDDNTISGKISGFNIYHAYKLFPASSNEILIYTEPNHYELYRINEDSYRLSFKTSGRYWKQYKVDVFYLDRIR